jgi:uncharacterized protein
MKKEFPSNIPQKRLEEIENIKKVVLEVSKKIIRVDMIILFWSYARGDFVESDVKFVEWHYEEYQSDFDILLVIPRPNIEKSQKLEWEISKLIDERNLSETPVSIIVEDIFHINKCLREERYFYVDIEKEWVILYDSEKLKIKKWIPLTKEEREIIKKDDFEYWFNSANYFFDDYKNNINDYKRFNNAAFYLHQSAERFITSYMLVKTWYKPKTHDVEKLYIMLLKEDKSFESWFDFGVLEEKTHFELLRRAYVDARYSKDYKISKEELKFLEEKVLKLKEIVEMLCEMELKK